MTDNTDKPQLAEGNRAYELGILLIPSLADADVSAAIEDIKEKISEKDGTIHGEGDVEYRDLVYEMEHVTGDNKQFFKNAHFTWIHFDTSGSDVEEIQSTLKEDPRVVRFLCITIDESRIGKGIDDLEENQETAEMSDAEAEEIDEAIDELVIE